MAKQKAEHTIEFSKTRITIYLTKAIYETIEQIARTQYSDSRSIKGVIQTYAVILFYYRLGYINKYVPIHKEIFQYISKRNYTAYRELLCKNGIIEYRKSEYTQYKTESGENRISSTTTEYRIAKVIGVLFDNDKTIPVHIDLPREFVMALEKKHKHIGEEYLSVQEKRKSILELNPMELVVVDLIAGLVKDVASNRITTKRAFEKRLSHIEQINKKIHFDSDLLGLIKRLVRVINNKQIAGNNLGYLFDNQFDVCSSKSNETLLFYQDLKADIEALDDCMTKRDLLHISRINTVPNYGNGGKIYSALANLRKPIRRHITYKGEKLVEVSDVSCAHFTMLPVIFKRHNIVIPNEELLRYQELTQKGDLYSAVVEGTDMLRADIKQTFQPFLSIKHKAQFLYGQDSEETRKRETICEYFEAHFPSIFNALHLWHTHTEQSIKSVANEVESDIMNPICSRLMDAGLHSFRIHDAIYLPENEVKALPFNIKDEVMKAINDGIPI